VYAVVELTSTAALRNPTLAVVVTAFKVSTPIGAAAVHVADMVGWPAIDAPGKEHATLIAAW
jgi:hypothetical protein